MTFEEILKAAGLEDEKVAEVKASLTENGIEFAEAGAADLQAKVDALQEKLEKYEGKTLDDGSKDVVIKDLRQQLNTERVKSALAAAHADDVDYLIYKIDRERKLDMTAEDLKEEEITKAVGELKTAYAGRFHANISVPSAAKRIDPQKWRETAEGTPEPSNLKEALMQKYEKEDV